MAIDSLKDQKTVQQIIDSTSKRSSERKIGELGKNEFINLLVTQLQYQDPLNPTEDKEFISQMAQFSSLEQMQNLNAAFSSVQGFSMLGKHVTGSIKDPNTFEVKPIEGEVTNVKMSGNKVTLIVNGIEVPVSSITDVREVNKNTVENVVNEEDYQEEKNISSYSGLIGHKAEGGVFDIETSKFMNIKGNVSSVIRGVDGFYAMFDDVLVNADSIDGLSIDSSLNEIQAYLQDKLSKKLNYIGIDNETGQKVPSTGLLRDYQINENGNIKLKLDKVPVLVDFIRELGE